MAGLRQGHGATVRAGLIGCGAIGSRLDEDLPDGPSLTHAAALARNPAAELVAVCDADPARAAECARRRGAAHAFTDPRAMLAAAPLDLVSICTPAAGRAELLAEVLAAGVRAVWLEKPLGSDLAEAERVAEMVAESGAVVAVNYLRRWSATLRRLCALAPELGPPAYGVVHYGKGVANNASHAVDCCAALFGPPRQVTALRRVEDGRADDPSLDMVVDFAGTPVHFLASDHRRFSLFEIDAVFRDGRARLTDKGDVLEVSRPGPDPMFPGYSALLPAAREDGGLAGTLDGALADLLACVAAPGRRPACTVGDALLAQRCAAAALESWRAGGATVPVRG